MSLFWRYIPGSPPSKPTGQNLLRPRKWGRRRGARVGIGDKDPRPPHPHPAATGKRSQAHRPGRPEKALPGGSSYTRLGTELRRRYNPGARARPASASPLLSLQAGRAAATAGLRRTPGTGCPHSAGQGRSSGPEGPLKPGPPPPGPLAPEKGKERQRDESRGTHLAEAARRGAVLGHLGAAAPLIRNRQPPLALKPALHFIVPETG